MPFTKDEAADAIVWLLENGVPSFSPETSKLLLSISQDVEKKLGTAEVSAGIREFLGMYAKQLYAVSVLGHLHQGAVITKLQMLIGESKASSGRESK